jgi:hypothetical protein
MCLATGSHNNNNKLKLLERVNTFSFSQLARQHIKLERNQVTTMHFLESCFVISERQSTVKPASAPGTVSPSLTKYALHKHVSKQKTQHLVLSTILAYEKSAIFMHKFQTLHY